MFARTSVWYPVGRTPKGMFEREIMSICNKVNRPYPEIKGRKVHRGSERPWTISITIRASETAPYHKEYTFGFMEQTWEEGKIRALQEISARLCHLHHEKLQPYAYHQFGRRGKDGVPIGAISSGAFTSHSEDMESILFTTQMSLERARDKVDRRSA